MFVLHKEAPIDVVGHGVKRQVLGYDDGLMMVRVMFAKGATAALHAHPHRQVTYVERGSFAVTINGTTTTVGAGDCFLVSPDVLHGASALEDGVLIDVFTPARKDFIEP
jgi:quercetin dioxygenase-like cupin family protein